MADNIILKTSTILNFLEILCLAIYSQRRINTALVKCFASLNRRIAVDVAGNQK